MLKRSGHVKDVYDAGLEMDETDDHVDRDAKRSPVLSKLRWAVLEGDLRRSREIQHRYAITPAEYVSRSYLQFREHVFSSRTHEFATVTRICHVYQREIV